MQTAKRFVIQQVPNGALANMFGMCKLLRMDITALRKELGLSQEAFAARVGLKSKGHLSQIERGEQTPSVRVALEIERLSGGRIKAASLSADVALVERFRAEAANDDQSAAEVAA